MADTPTRMNFSWYRNLSMREQRLILAMTLLIIFCILYYAVWIPVGHSHKAAEDAYRQELELLQWVRANESRVHTPPDNNASSGDATPLPTLLTNMAKDNHFTITRLEAGADDKVMLTLEHVPFNNFISAMNDLEQTHYVTVLTAAISKSDTPGQVNATLQLKK